jgi:hypothetical protein
MLHGAIFLTTCNAILLLRDVKLPNTSLHYTPPVNSIYLPGTITFSHLAVKKWSLAWATREQWRQPSTPYSTSVSVPWYAITARGQLPRHIVRQFQSPYTPSPRGPSPRHIVRQFQSPYTPSPRGLSRISARQLFTPSANSLANFSSRNQKDFPKI